VAGDGAARDIKMQYRPPDKSSEHEISSILKTKAVNNYIVVHPGSGDVQRLWPISKWAGLGDKLTDRYGVQVVLTGTLDELPAINDILRMAKSKPVVAAGVVSIAGFFELVKRARLLVGLESFSAHVAAAVGTESIIIHNGFQDVNVWKPWGNTTRLLTSVCKYAPCNSICVPGDLGCINSVEIDDVMNISNEILVSR